MLQYHNGNVFNIMCLQFFSLKKHQKNFIGINHAEEPEKISYESFNCVFIFAVTVIKLLLF